MPRYYFDIDENGTVVRDEVGLDLPDLGRAIIEAKAPLPDLAREALCQKEDLTVRSRVRDEGGDLVFEATLQMETRRLR